MLTVCACAQVTQAGVALGLARTVLARFPVWGPDFYALMVATIVLTQAVGPPLFRAAIVAMGEQHKSRGLPSVATPVAAAPALDAGEPHDEEHTG